jgi:hypothetical protein
MGGPGTKSFDAGPEEVKLTIIDILNGACSRSLSIDPRAKAEAFLRRVADLFGRDLLTLQVTSSLGRNVQNGERMDVHVTGTCRFHLHKKTTGG